jgi:hypothetical protein
MKRGPPDLVGGLSFISGGNKRGPPGSVGGLGGSMGGVGCPITANWEALSVAIDTIEPTDVTIRKNLVIFFIF